MNEINAYYHPPLTRTQSTHQVYQRPAVNVEGQINKCSVRSKKLNYKKLKFTVRAGRAGRGAGGGPSRQTPMNKELKERRTFQVMKMESLKWGFFCGIFFLLGGNK
ncbi:hypothetical protein EVAR_69139_1 [Eumeta japonica]|uniref:Uncharacterized protein n=1 Tax=Eumeta variegata TaxID=151549 RepID=A0A4C2A170_EUMVA|nr:hypothetical protein EVAR_69139_1 [Eumeta japonica]